MRQTAVIIVPPQPMLGDLRKEMRNKNLLYNASNIRHPKSLEYKPHVTLKSLGRISKDDYRKAWDELVSITRFFEPFVLTAEGLRFFGSTRMHKGIYIPVSVVENPELLLMHERLVKSMKKYSDGKDRSFKENENYNPHITLVGDDISEEDLKRARRELTEIYSCKFPVNKITLVSYLEEVGKYLYSDAGFGGQKKETRMSNPRD